MARLTWIGLWIICTLVLIWASVQMLGSILFGRRERAWQLAIAVDQTANVTIGGSVDEMISARAYRRQHQPKWNWLRKAIDWLFLHARGENDHCRKAFESEYRRSQLPEEYQCKDLR